MTQHASIELGSLGGLGQYACQFLGWKGAGRARRRKGERALRGLLDTPMLPWGLDGPKQGLVADITPCGTRRHVKHLKNYHILLRRKAKLGFFLLRKAFRNALAISDCACFLPGNRRAAGNAGNAGNDDLDLRELCLTIQKQNFVLFSFLLYNSNLQWKF